MLKSKQAAFGWNRLYNTHWRVEWSYLEFIDAKGMHIGHQCARKLICQFSVYFEHPKYTENLHFAPKLRRFVSVSFEVDSVQDMMERATVNYFRFPCTQTSDFVRYDDVTRGTSMCVGCFCRKSRFRRILSKLRNTIATHTNAEWASAAIVYYKNWPG